MNHGQTLASDALHLLGIGRTFGGIHAVRDVALRVAHGERRAVIGPNGAGKTTLFNLIAGDDLPTSGAVVLFGEDVTRLAPRHRARRGLTRTYQTAHLFGGLTTLENLFLAVRGVAPRRMSMLRPRPDDAYLARARELAAQVGLERVLHTRVGALSHGEQRQLELAMALAGRPRLIMLDEPAAGLSPGERTRLTELLLGLERSITLLLIEHDMDVALRIAQVVTVMHNGSVIAVGTPDEIRASQLVHELYLGMGTPREGGHA
jgi:branched-chain amino acid transport system ATP-binding protein